MRRRQQGHAMIELALSAGVLVTALAGTFQFGYHFYVYNQLVTAVGNGGRYAAMRTYRGATDGDVEKVRTAIRNMVVYGDAHPGSDAAPVATGLRAEHVSVEWVREPGSETPSAVDISIRKFQVNGLFGAFVLDGRPRVEFPFLGRYAPQESEP